MNTLRFFIQRMSWPGLVLCMVMLLISGIYVSKLLSLSIGSDMLILLMIMGLGLAGVVVGSAVAKHSKYELAPQPRQILGALFAGVAMTIMVYSAIQLVSIDYASGIILLLTSISILFFIEFSLMRISQANTVNIFQLASLALITFVVVLIMNGFAGLLQLYVWMFIGSGIISLFISRTGHTYLLSPWVNSFWNGLAMLAAGVFMLFSTTSGFVGGIVEIAYLPLWIGFAIAGVSILALIFKQFRHKMLISKGYMQYKLQAFTALLLATLYIFNVEVSEKFLLAFLLIMLAYSLSEKRFVVKE